MKTKSKTARKKAARTSVKPAPRRQQAKTAAAKNMYEGPKKRYLKTACRVTFKLPSQAAAQASEVNLVGEFNSWDRQSTPMRKLKDGTFAVTVKLETGKAYRFRYLIDATRWENDWRADRYEPNSFGDDDSVVVV